MKRIVAGNWKMNHGPSATRDFLDSFLPRFDPANAEVLLFPPSPSLSEARMQLGATPGIYLGIQHIHAEASGAFTGEISAEIAAEVGATYALIGHSERRQLFFETDAGTRDRVVAAYRAGLSPLLCVGETIAERRDGRLADVLLRQLDAVLSSEAVLGPIGREAPFVLAYEPVWAIGTGETATPADASEAHTILRERLAHHLGLHGAASVPILYGGSVNPGNAGELMASPEVNGVLVGGASLKADSFAAIVDAG